MRMEFCNLHLLDQVVFVVRKKRYLYDVIVKKGVELDITKKIYVNILVLHFMFY